MEAKPGWILVLAIIWKNSILVESSGANTKQVKAEWYEIIIHNRIDEEEPRYEGEVNIKILCLEKTQTIALYTAGFYVERSSLDMNQLLTENEIKIEEEDKNDSTFIKLEEDEPNLNFPMSEFLANSSVKLVEDNKVMVTFKKFLHKDCKYEIKIRFHGKYNDARSSYILKTYIKEETSTEDINFQLGYVVSTKFRNDSRPVFPFLDQMDEKTKFKLWLYYPSYLNLMGFSNAISKKKIFKRVIYDPEPFEKLVLMEEFEETEPIAPSSVAIALLDFKCAEVDQYPDVKIQTWVDGFVAKELSAFNEYVSKIFTHFLNYFGESYSLTKLDLFALPNATFEIEEHFGIIFMSKQFVLDVIHKGVEPHRFSLVSDLCHAINFQWIGGVVTMGDVTKNWWHRGLNKFLQVECVGELYKEFSSNLLELSVIESFINFLRSEETKEYEKKSEARSYPDSHPMINMPDDKAFHLVRMLCFILGSSHTFHNAMVKYVHKFQVESVNLSEALNIFSSVFDDPILNKQGSILSIMEPWFNQKGIPLIMVERDYKKKEVAVSQKIFDSLELEKPLMKLIKKKTECWTVLLSYTTSLTPIFGKDVAKEWLGCEDKPILKLGFQDLSEKDWILFNLDLEVPGRVMYDKKNYDAIKNTLLKPPRYKEINGLTRVRFLSDIFALAEGALLSYEYVFDTVMYLKHETMLAPWKVALKELDRIRSRLLGSDLFEKYQKFVQKILQPAFEKRKFSSLTDPSFTNNLDTHLGVLIFEYSCKFGVTKCHQTSTLTLSYWINMDGFAGNLKSHHIAYRVGMCEHFKDPGNENLINEFFSRSYVNNQPDAREDLLQAFGCSTNEKTLQELLYSSVNVDLKTSPEDSIIIFQSLSSNEKGYKLMKEFFMNQYARIKSFHSSFKDWEKKFKLSYLSILFDNTNEENDLKELKTFAKQIIPRWDDTKSKNVRNARRNINWHKENKARLKSVLNKYETTKK